MSEENEPKTINNYFKGILNKNMGKTEIKTIKFNEEYVKEETFKECPDINKNETTWIRIIHLSEDKSIEKLFKCLNLNDHVLKKVFRLDFIPDIEDYKNYIYCPLTVLYIHKKTSIEQLQVSLILGENYVISIHYDDAQIFNSVMNRLNIHEHQIRNKGDDYLAYTFIDTIFDSHIVTLKELEGEISKLAEKIMNDPSTDNFRLIHIFRAELDKIRHFVLPLQQIINSMELTESYLINQSTETFLNNFQRHVAQVVDRIDTLSNRITEIRDIYIYIYI